MDTARLNLNSFSYGSIAGTSERASSTDVDYGGRGVERSKNDEAFSALGCGSAGFIDRHGNGARPISEQSTGSRPATSGQSSGSQSDPRGTGMTGAPQQHQPTSGWWRSWVSDATRNCRSRRSTGDTNSQSEQAITGFNLRRCVLREGGHSAPFLLLHGIQMRATRDL